MIASLLQSVVQILLLLALAPLVSGVIRTLKARLQTRRGPSVLQPYSELRKLFHKGMVIPETASWIFRATPWVVFVSTVMAGLMIPMVSAQAPLGLFGGVLAVIYLLGLGRFFLALGGLDTGGSFGGLGSSREMTISALAEPAMMLAIFTVAIGAGSHQPHADCANRHRSETGASSRRRKCSRSPRWRWCSSRRRAAFP